MGVFLLISFLIIGFSRYSYAGVTDFWWFKHTLLLGLLSACLAHKIHKEYHWSAAIAFFWAMIVGIITFSFYDNQFNSIGDSLKILASFYAAYGTFTALIIIVTIMGLKEKYTKLENIFGFLCLVNSLYVIFQLFNGNGFLNRGGFFGNGSINACFIAFTYPMLVFRQSIFKPWVKAIIAIIPIVAILVSKTSVPVGVIAIVLSSYMFFKIKNLRHKIIVCSLVFIVLIFMGRFIDSQFFNDGERFEMFWLTLKAFYYKVNMLIGTGHCTFPLFGPLIQLENKFRPGEFFIWLHSDWIQLMFEAGIIGIVLYINLFLFSIYKSIVQKRYYLTSAVLGYGSAMVFSYPLHYALLNFYGVLLIAIILRRKNGETYRQ